ncbi:hypothetical protein M9Y10_003906 [Tritrichomonas musculus]|uniref:Uncharacterized protein n=1 Tax=Tritrichomonas musculus TaxID=1915356 RepID=A0ABR2JQJ6_9EUKA
MWDGDEKIHLPKTKSKKSFYITSFKGELYFILPGLVYAFDKESSKFVQIKQKPKLPGKVDRIITSPCGGASLHLPKDDPFIFYHENSNNGKIFAIPYPRRILNSKNNSEKINTCNAASSISYLKIPSGEDLLITNPEFKQNNSPSFAYGKSNSFTTKNVFGISISENRNSIALAYKEHLYIWQQCCEQVIGTGFWTDLSGNQDIKINTGAITMNGKTYGKSNHGCMKPQQVFTLEDPNFAPTIPINSEIAYQDMRVFNNPDEGVGVCCLTMLLPPYRPFDRLYIFNSITNFDKQENGKYVFQRYDATMPIIEGVGAPCVWWSIDCRLFVLAVSQSLMIMTRHLRIIKILPLKSVFSTVKTTIKHENEPPLVADISWSCQGEFFVVTSVQGQVGIVTRSGISLKHSICALEAFNIKSIGPLLVTADSVIPTLFNIYSPDSLILRRFNLNKTRIPRDLQGLMSLQFPQVSSSKLWDITIKAILKNGISDKTSLVRLLYYTDLFCLFPYYSPLRSLLVPLFEDGAMKAFKSGDDIFTYFVVRCIFRLTRVETKAYSLIHKRLSQSKDRKDRVLFKILDDELNKRDYSITNEEVPRQIKIYQQTLPKEYEMMGKIKTRPYASRNANLDALVDAVIDVLYNNDFGALNSVICNLNIFAELLIHLDQPDKAMVVARHPSIDCDPAQFFIKIATHYSKDAAKLYVSLLRCIKAAPESEMDLRAICVRAIVNILKQKLADSIQKWKNVNKREKETISKLANLEAELQIVHPKDVKQLQDFGIIFAIALCAAGYTACLNYVCLRSTQIPENLRSSVRHLFHLLWFIQWRNLVINAPSNEEIKADALLRLLAFPEFININSVKSQIESFGDYSEDIFKIYIRERPIIEQDPKYTDFLSHCKSKLNYPDLSNVSTSVISMSKISEKIPYSGILIAAIISHMIPWLRCGIPRALANLSCYDSIPKKLIEFEDYKFPSADQDYDYYEEEEEYSSSSSYSSYLSEGEYKGPTKGITTVKQTDLSKIPKVIEDKQPKVEKKQKIEPVIKKRRKSKKKAHIKAELLMPSNKPYTNAKPFEYQNHPQPPVVIHIPNYYPVIDPPTINVEPEPEKPDVGAPIWSFCPNDFVNPQPSEIIIEEEEEFVEEEEEKLPEAPPKPVYVNISTDPINYGPPRKTVETQFEPPPQPPKKKPIVRIIKKKQFVPPPMEEPLQLSISSSESDLYLTPMIPKRDPANDPFPLDEGLRKKIDDKINDINKIPEPQKLPPKPMYVPVKRDIVIPSLDDFSIDKNKYELDPDAFNIKKEKKETMKRIQAIQTIQNAQEFHIDNEMNLTNNTKPQNKNLKRKPKREQTRNKMSNPANEIVAEQFKRDLENQKINYSIKQIDDE